MYIYIAFATITPLERIVSRSDIECPGDRIPYNCSILSNSETIHLTWLVKFPGQPPMNITYDISSSLRNIDILNSAISTSLERFESDKYIESTLEVMLRANLPTNQTKIDCTINDLGNDSVLVNVNSTGERMQLVRPV